MRKSHYIILVSRDTEGRLQKVPIPMKYAYVFVTAAVVGAFTIMGMAGSYTRMLLKTAKFNQVRSEREALRKDYKNLEAVARERDVQAASLGALASEVTAFYGLRSTAAGSGLGHGRKDGSAAADLKAPVSDTFTDSTYARSLDQLYALRNSAMSGVATQGLSFGSVMAATSVGDWATLASAPSLWPIEGAVTSSFGEREDPFNGEGAFHKGIDISARIGTPVHAPADGTVMMAGFGSGYGREVVLDHGHGVSTVYGHLSAWNVVAGQQVKRGDIIAYTGDSGRSTGAHLHYEVRLNDQPVNPHKYLRETFAQVTDSTASGAM